ncbi:MAG TPA: c-type cytochrome [Gaiellaceae bacterium]
MRRVLPVIPLLLAGLVLAGCSSSRPYDHSTAKPLPSTVVGTVAKAQAVVVPAAYKNGDSTAGKQVFETAGCKGCHTLKDAGATGTVGPNLDQAQPALSKVVTQVLNGGGAMPPFKGQLSDKQIANVAAYVVKATGGNPNG